MEAAGRGSSPQPCVQLVTEAVISSDFVHYIRVKLEGILETNILQALGLTAK